MTDLDLDAVERCYGPQSTEDARIVCILVAEVKRLRGDSARWDAALAAHAAAYERWAAAETALIARLAEVERERDEARAADRDHKLLADEWWRKYRDTKARADAAEARLEAVRSWVGESVAALDEIHPFTQTSRVVTDKIAALRHWLAGQLEADRDRDAALDAEATDR